jgi:chromosome segregation ATPase
VAEESVRSNASESLEELSGEWMRQQLQDAALHSGPRQEASGYEPAYRPAPPPPAAPPQEPAAPAPDDVLAGLAQSVSQAVVSAVSQLDNRRAAEKRSLEMTVRDQEQRLEQASSHLSEIQDRFNHLASLIEEQRQIARSSAENYDRLAVELSEVRRLEASRESILEDLRRETLDLSVSVSDRQDQVAGRLDLQQNDIEELKGAVAQLRTQLEQTGERVHKHADLLRSLYAVERRRDAALDSISEAARSLKSSLGDSGLSDELL